MRDKQTKFKELAERIVNNAIKQLELIGNLSNKNNYSYSEEDCQKIFRAIDNEVKEVKRRFVEADNRSNKRFSF